MLESNSMTERGSRGVPIKAFELKVVGLDREGGCVGDYLGRRMCVYLNSSLMPIMSGNIEHLHHLCESSKSSDIHLNHSNAAASSVTQTIISSLSSTSSLPLLSTLNLLTHNQHRKYIFSRDRINSCSPTITLCPPQLTHISINSSNQSQTHTDGYELL
jgi:hypothetical protein